MAPPAPRHAAPRGRGWSRSQEKERAGQPQPGRSGRITHQPGDKFHFAVPVITNLHCVSDHHYRRPVRGTLIKWTSLS